MLRKYSKLLTAILIPTWVVISFFAAQALVTGLAWVLVKFGVSLILINQAVLNTLVAVFVYLITLTLVIGAPWLIKKRRTNLTDIGLDRLPTWIEIFIAPAGFVVYFIISAILILIATKVLPGFDANQIQDVGFKQVGQNYEFILAFISLVVLVPLSEEILFRGYLYGKLRKLMPFWVAILITSVLFGALHGAWNIAIDTFALSIVLCLLREFTGSIWPSVLLHMIKNSIAFYILFINPSILATLVK